MPEDKNTIVVGHVQPPSNSARTSFKMLEEITPKDVRDARKQAQQGRPARLYAILEFFRQFDDEIPGAMQSLVSAITTDDVVVEMEEESDAAERQQAFAESVLEDLDVISLLEDLLLGHYLGLRAEELVWGPYTFEGQTYQAPLTYESLPMEWIYAEKEQATMKHNTLYIGNQPYYQYQTGHVLLYVDGKLPSFRDIDFNAFGCGQAAARYGVFSWYGWEDWARLAEAFGTPFILGTLMQGWGADDKALLEQAVMNVQGDSRAVISEKSKLEIKDSPFKASSSGLYDKLIEASARARARVIKSESLTDNMNQHGSNAAMLTTNGIRLDVAGRLARRLRRLLTRHLLHPMLDLNFPEGRLVSLKVHVEAIADMLMEARIDKTLFDTGLPLSRSEMYARYGRRKPETPEDTLERSATSFDPFGGV